MQYHLKRLRYFDQSTARLDENWYACSAAAGIAVATSDNDGSREFRCIGIFFFYC